MNKKTYSGYRSVDVLFRKKKTEVDHNAGNNALLHEKTTSKQKPTGVSARISFINRILIIELLRGICQPLPGNNRLYDQGLLMPSVSLNTDSLNKDG